MAHLDDLFRITIEMVEVLNKFERDEIDRPATIEKMTILIEQRDELIKLIKAPYTEEELAIGKKVIQLNEEIAKKMQDLYTLVKEDMNQVKQQKVSSRSYMNPYGNLRTTDGMYVDSKK